MAQGWGRGWWQGQRLLLGRFKTGGGVKGELIPIRFSEPTLKGGARMPPLLRPFDSAQDRQAQDIASGGGTEKLWQQLLATA